MENYVNYYRFNGSQYALFDTWYTEHTAKAMFLSEGFWIREQNTDLVLYYFCNIPGCDYCSAPNSCSSCTDMASRSNNQCLCTDPGFTMSYNTGFCVPCDINGCLRCDAPDDCALFECSSVYGCTKCSNANICQQCTTNSTLSVNNTCSCDTVG